MKTVTGHYLFRTVLCYYSILTVLVRYYYSIKSLHSLAVFTNLSSTVLQYNDVTMLQHYMIMPLLSLSLAVFPVYKVKVLHVHNDRTFQKAGAPIHRNWEQRWGISGGRNFMYSGNGWSISETSGTNLLSRRAFSKMW